MALEVIKLSQEEEVDLDRIIETIGRDPAFAARVLKLGNSPLFGRRGEVTSLGLAVMTIGLKAVKMAAISLSLVPAMSGRDPAQQERLRATRRRAVTAAVLARDLIQRLGKPFAEEAALCGLLMDIGFSALVWSGHPPYVPVLAAAGDGHPDMDAERAAIGATHAEVSAWMLREWNLPEMLVLPVVHHHDPEALEDSGQEAALDLARVLAIAHDVGTIVTSARMNRCALAEAKRKGDEWFGLDSDAMDAFLATTVDRAYQMADLMEVDIGAREDMALLLAEAQEDLLTMSVGASVELENSKGRIRDLQEKATRDALTGIRNRAAFDEAIDREWRMRQTGIEKTSLGIIMVDVDKFKRFNDTYGHQAGDHVLQCVAHALEDHCRTKERISDLVARYGGEEFVVIVPGVTESDLEIVTERLRAAVEAAQVRTDAGVLHVTASFGGAVLVEVSAGLKATALIEAADQNLYRAKEAGRNRCVVSTLTVG